jgi:hypothetical protein
MRFTLAGPGPGARSAGDHARLSATLSSGRREGLLLQRNMGRPGHVARHP